MKFSVLYHYATPSSSSTLMSSILSRAASFFLLSIVITTCSAVTLDTCDIFDDLCGKANNRKCNRGEDGNTAACNEGDCFDCDPCQQFNFDCEGCRQADGCLWCAGDAFCSSAAKQFDMGRLYSSATCPMITDWLGEDDVQCQPQGTVFSDPLYMGNKWAFDMLNVEPVWQQGITGDGVHVRINDSGADLSHAEFEGRADIANSCEDYLPGEESDGTIKTHGTIVASIVGAGRDNGVCSTGIAPGVTMSSCDVISDIRRFGDGYEVVDISQNAYGRNACEKIRRRKRNLIQQQQQLRRLQDGDDDGCPFSDGSAPCGRCDFTEDDLGETCEQEIARYCSRRPNFIAERDICTSFLDLFATCDYNTLTGVTADTMLLGIKEGRDGKGIIYVFASGNDFQWGADVNFQGFTNSRFTISVGAVGRNGLHADYSTSGAALFVSGPGGDSEDLLIFAVAKVGGGCQNSGVGTSFACPAVSGVIALVLEANSDLGWRDVQHILAATSQQVEDPNDDSVVVNGAGFWHSNYYGFGIPDAAAAVEMATGWTNIEPESSVQEQSARLDLVINDDSSETVTTTLSMSAPHPNFVAESVVILLDLEHASRGDLLITLRSPAGTRSVLHPSRRPENSQPEDGELFRLLTVRNWGESVEGSWELEIVDEKVSNAVCSDFDLDFTTANGEILCSDLPRTVPVLCEDGEVMSTQAERILSGDDVSLAEACCVCGGGHDLSEAVDRLVSWELIIFGRIDLLPTGPSDGTTSPTDTTSPTLMPTVGPTQDPTGLPSIKPTMVPTVSATPTESFPPTLSPSGRPTSNPSSDPSHNPSTKPTGVPTQASSAPSSEPSKPTNAPTLTLFPSSRPNELAIADDGFTIPVDGVGVQTDQNSPLSKGFDVNETIDNTRTNSASSAAVHSLIFSILGLAVSMLFSF